VRPVAMGRKKGIPPQSLAGKAFSIPGKEKRRDGREEKKKDLNFGGEKRHSYSWH